MELHDDNDVFCGLISLRLSPRHQDGSVSVSPRTLSWPALHETSITAGKHPYAERARIRALLSYQVQPEVARNKRLLTAMTLFRAIRADILWLRKTGFMGVAALSTVVRPIGIEMIGKIKLLILVDRPLRPLQRSILIAPGLRMTNLANP